MKKLPSGVGLAVFAAAIVPAAFCQSSNPPSQGPSANGHQPAAAPAKAAAPAPTARQRMRAEAQRNENVAVYLIDMNAVKESNIRVGTSTTAVAEPRVESQYFATEHGRPASDTLGLRPTPPAPVVHGEGTYWHQNSIFNARTFFQAGAVKPSHRNLFGGRLTGPLPGLPGFWTATYAQRDIRGMVNGNVLVPLAEERTPTATDPATRAIVQSYIDAFPDELPNRPDFDLRALNTNSPQRIDSLNGSGRIDLLLPRSQRLMGTYSIDRQKIRAFQFVAGQNPDTDLHTTRAGLTWTRDISPNSSVAVSGAFQRGVSLLVSEPNAVGPRVRFGHQIEELGPDSMFPIDRTARNFRTGAALSNRLAGGTHTLTWGGDYSGYTQEGYESNNSRGYFQFTSNFGRTAIQNFLLGTPSIYEIAVGNTFRGFRNSTVNAYFADNWRLHPRLQMYIGVRYMADTRPVETHGIDKLPYDSDTNNFSPRFSLAWQAGRGWVVRTMYTTSFLQIPPVTYQQIRNNPPGVMYVMAQDPNLVDPLKGVALGPGARHVPTWISPDLASPYSHQYNATIEKRFAWGGLLRTAYVGSRTIKLMNSLVQNRAVPVPGIPLTTATVNSRRPDSRYYETYNILNGGIAYFDAGQASFDMPVKKGFSGQFSYTFSKALDEGPDFSATAANQDLLKGRSQWQYELFKDRKGYSNFDSPHALTASYSYEIPAFRTSTGWLRAALNGWTVSGVNLWKKGTPTTMYVGSDSPGFGNVDGGPSDRPNLLDPSILGATISHPDVAPSILRRDRFSFIVPGENRGSAGRGAFRRARIWNWNGSVVKQLSLPHEFAAQIRGEVYNLSNTPQFDEPQRNLSSPSFGRITNTLNDGRVFQLGLRLLF